MSARKKTEPKLHLLGKGRDDALWLNRVRQAAQQKKYNNDTDRLTKAGHDVFAISDRQRTKLVALIDCDRLAIKRSKQTGVKRLHALRLRQAMPSWADKNAIDALYLEALRLSCETGIPHEVDHIEPLLGDGLSGLHVEYNLRVVTRSDNRSKSNKRLS